jgi:P-type Cu+ transporter
MPLDPVCGMFVRESANAVLVQGHRYHFCSRVCLRRFTAPERELAWLQRSAALAIAAGVVLFAVPQLRLLEEPLLGAFLLALGTVVQIVAGRPFYQGIGHALVNRAPNMDTLIALGTTAAWLFGALAFLTPSVLPGQHVYYFEVSALVLGFVSAGRSIEQKMRGQASTQVRQLLEMQPTTAHLLKGREEVEVPVEDIGQDAILLVRANERMPVDGIVVEGESAVDEKLLTGESVPVDKRPGDRVIGGSVNCGGPLQVRATQVGGATALARIISLIGEAQTNPTRFQRTADALSAWFVPLVVGVALAAFAGWYFVAGATLPFAFGAFVAVLLIACPSALGLAAPAALAVGVSKGASQGILVKDAEVLERTQKVDVVVFDKTGTLTQGAPALTDVHAVQGTEADLLAIAAAAEEGSEHPLAKTIVRAARARGLQVETPDRVRPMAGVGVEAELGGEEVLVGNQRLLGDRRIDLGDAHETLAKLQGEGKTVVLVARQGELAGLLAFADPIRPEAAAAVRELQAMGIEVCIVTGDHARTAQAIARQLSIRRSFAEITPHGKAAVVRGLQQGGKVVAMVGDGVNDAPALAAAQVGVAIGSGAEVALEAADLVLMKSDPRDVPTAIALSRKTLTKVRQNLGWAFSYNIVLVPLAALGLLNPVIAGLAMAFSTIPVIANSMRMERTWDLPGRA